MVKSFHKRRKEYKLEAVRAVKAGRSVAEVAKLCEVSAVTVYQWIRKHKAEVDAEGTIETTFNLRPWKRFDEEFKMAAVQEVEGGRSVPEVAKECDVSEQAVYEWLGLYSEAVRKNPPGLSLEELQTKLAAGDEEKERKLAAKQQEKKRNEDVVREAMADPITWMQKYTKTKDSHWRENGADSPYRHLPDRPDRPQFRVMLDDFEHKKEYFVPKSRDMLVSWTLVGIFTHKAMTTPGVDILFQSQKQEKANELVGYAKILYEQSDEAIRRAYPLDKKIQAEDRLVFANGSRIIAIPGGGDQIRSYHPWGLLMDEAAFMPEAGDSFNIALPVCEKIVVASSAGPGWFAETVNDRAEKQPERDEAFERYVAALRKRGIINSAQ